MGMARNPYDRRSSQVVRTDAGLLAGFGPRESPVAFEDLEALVNSALGRGLREGENRHRREEHKARREAWDQGHEVGVGDGRDELLGRIDERFGAELRVAIKASEELLARFKGDERKASKRDFVERVERHVSLLERLTDAHHARFEEIPF